MTVSNADQLPTIGRSLSTEERAALDASIPLLASRYKAPAAFWGKICGLTGDYLIAQVVPHGFFGPRVSFYSVDGGNHWKLLEDPTEEQAEFCDTLRGVYQGNPMYAYKMRKVIPPEPEPTVEVPPKDAALNLLDEQLEADIKAAGAQGEDGDEESDEDEGDEEEEDEEVDEEALLRQRRRKNKPKIVILSVSETIRLAHFVLLHDSACRLTVRGAYLLTGGSTGEANRAFEGQPLHNALKPSCYLKAHQLGDPGRNRILYGATYNPHTDYLRPVTDDAPVGVWTVKYDATLNVVAVQNLFYEGSLFWYRPGTLEQGQVYYGNGERNLDLCFTL